MSQRKFCYQARGGIVTGLAQKLKIGPQDILGRSRMQAAARVLTVQLVGINPHYLSQITGMVNELTMFAGLDDKHLVRIGWQGRNIIIEVPFPATYWQKVTLDQLEARHLIERGPIATLGLGLQNNAMRLDFKRADMAHTFITGQTRSGKTNAQRLIGWNLAHNTTPDEAQMIIFDVAKRGYKWADFGNVANLGHPVVTRLEEADKVLAWASQEIDRRGEQGRTSPKIFMLIDELKALADDSKVAGSFLARIASVGGEFGLHMVLSTQYPQIQMFGDKKTAAELKRNVTTRLCGRVDDATAATNALGVSGSGAETLQGYGDMLLKDIDGLNRLTVAKIEAYHVEKLPRAETVSRLELPDDDMVNSGAPSPTHPSGNRAFSGPFRASG